MDDVFTVSRVMEVDFPRLVAFYNQYGKDLLSKEWSMPSLSRRKFLTGDSAAWLMLLDLTRPSEDAIVAAGFAYLGDSGTRRVASIEMILTRSDYRGRGLGDQIMDALHVWGARHQVERFLLTSKPTREAARRLYIRKGYQLIEGSDRHFFFDPPCVGEEPFAAVPS